MTSELSISRIVEEFGKYYLKEGQNRQRLTRTLMQPSVTLEKHATRITTEETIYRAANYLFGSVIQPFSTDFTPVSNLKFIPNEIKLRQVKTDIKIIPNDIEDSWLGFLSANNCTIKEWPIVRFIMEDYVKKQIEEDRELKMVYTGKYDPSSDQKVPGVCMDGIKQLLIDGVQRSEYPINVISGLGTPTAENILDYLEAFDAALPDLYYGEKVVIFVSPQIARWFLTAKRAAGHYFISSDESINYKIDFSHHEIWPCPAMAGTTDIWATTPNNLIWLTKRFTPISNMQMQVEDRFVKLLLDWWEAVGFRCNQMVWVTAETVGASATDTASPADGIIVRSLYPTVEAAKNVDHESAKVSGEVLGELPEGATVKVNYGTSTSLGTLSSSLTAASGKYTAEIGSLSASTKYYYRLEVTIGTDKYLSETKDFSTTAAPAGGGGAA